MGGTETNLEYNKTPRASRAHTVDMACAPHHRLFPRAPDISYVAAPYCFNAIWRGGDAAHSCRTDTTCIDDRSYIVNAICNCHEPLHCFFYTVLKDKNKHVPTGDDLHRFVSILNHKPVLRGLQDKLQPNPPCNRPFSVGAILNRPQPAMAELEADYTVRGIAFHCHCASPFSITCWRGAAAAISHMRSTSAGGSAARTAERRRAACQDGNPLL